MAGVCVQKPRDGALDGPLPGPQDPRASLSPAGAAGGSAPVPRSRDGEAGEGSGTAAGSGGVLKAPVPARENTTAALSAPAEASAILGLACASQRGQARSEPAPALGQITGTSENRKNTGSVAEGPGCAVPGGRRRSPESRASGKRKRRAAAGGGQPTARPRRQQRAPEKLYRCPLCRQEFQYCVSVNAHMRAHSLESPFRCLECGKGLPSGPALHAHQRSHAALKPYECPECGGAFRHRSAMAAHRRRHWARRPFQCSLCGKRFRLGGHLLRHRFLHTGQRPFRCPDCGRTFAFARSARAHGRLHRRRPGGGPLQAHGEEEEGGGGGGGGSGGGGGGGGAAAEPAEPAARRAWAGQLSRKLPGCPECGRAFRHSAALAAHRRRHTGERPFQCSLCGKRFRLGCSLHRHLFLHTGQRPFRCPDCGRTFAFARSARAHGRLHRRRPHRCPHCRRAYRQEAELGRHVLLAHAGAGSKPLPWPGSPPAQQKTPARAQQRPPEAGDPRREWSRGAEGWPAWGASRGVAQGSLLSNGLAWVQYAWPPEPRDGAARRAPGWDAAAGASPAPRQRDLTAVPRLPAPPAAPHLGEERGAQGAAKPFLLPPLPPAPLARLEDLKRGSVPPPARPRGDRGAPQPQQQKDRRPHTPGSPALQRPPVDRRLQCMICGRSYPRELDLHQHYMQHAQGQI